MSTVSTELPEEIPPTRLVLDVIDQAIIGELKAATQRIQAALQRNADERSRMETMLAGKRAVLSGGIAKICLSKGLDPAEFQNSDFVIEVNKQTGAVELVKVDPPTP